MDWIRFGNNNNKVTSINSSIIHNNEKSRWKKVASKEITLEEFHSESSAREELFDIIFGSNS